LASDVETRDSMNVFDVRFSLFPFEALEAGDLLRPVKVEGEYVYEEQRRRPRGIGLVPVRGYQWADVPWKPTLTYRYASFEGDDPARARARATTRSSTASTTGATGTRARCWASTC